MDIGDRKAKLERDIALAVAQLQEQFENDTGCAVEWIEIQMIEDIQMGGKRSGVVAAVAVAVDREPG